MTAPTTMFTIGHGSDSFDEFLERITRHGVTTVVDVRSHPTSRHAPDFRKRVLERVAAAAGVGYRWLGSSLGGRPDDPSLLTDGDPDWGRMASTPAFTQGIAELIGLSRTSAVAIMCSELDPRGCHRSLLIAPELVSAGFTVLDILGDGNVAPHQTPLV